MNQDPFAYYMDFWAPTLGIADAFESWLEKMRMEGRHSAYVMPDIAPFRSNDGAYINGRMQWRDHLKVNDLQELGHADIKHQGEQWQKRKQSHQERLKRSDGVDVTASVPSDFRPEQASRLQTEIANRLHGRPTPPRKELIKLAIEQAKRMKHG